MSLFLRNLLPYDILAFKPAAFKGPEGGAGNGGLYGLARWDSEQW